MTKTKRNYTRFYNKWRNDSDYIKTLPAAEKEWMEKFIGEYYQGNKPELHPQAMHNELYASYHSAQNDVLTAPLHVIEAQVEQIHRQYQKSKNPSEITRWYTPSDWTAAIVEDELELSFPTPKKFYVV
jgi:hypothetical protein